MINSVDLLGNLRVHDQVIIDFQLENIRKNNWADNSNYRGNCEGLELVG